MKSYFPETASQTAGPYVHIGLAPDAAGFHIFEKNFCATLANSHTEGERITIEGRVIDGSGTPVRDVLLEIWQANAHGRYNHPADRQEEKPVDADFRGWGRSCSDFDSGVWRFETVKPGVVTGRDGRPMAPHVNLWIVARGINIGLNTRMYFSDEQEANRRDPVLNLIEWEVRRQTLIGQRERRGDEIVYRFDIHLQGEQETVFFDL
ncbi:protocatechuate 3,4-dioxygenase subunit alpha [Intestinirhabdus alba]|jgi:protocatechuate 3,4-dioxygenase alpha subunit|uniref:Protocatechuate 3,4-dioxygenase subunit alpha n=1 Tax=Intestinirhabdus alba TaxID=2899544 RepID=A0A6L6IJ56_9ENTR|nr:protocatechuate 3,4-dioxygenase subunit alpha [Intestinirhabdus alba]MTH45974.1 protocatechuate 3,4-dioxygenase subunit alpha [Intestinirhabdus alba]